jgi:hypothetical protein
MTLPEAVEACFAAWQLCQRSGSARVVQASLAVITPEAGGSQSPHARALRARCKACAPVDRFRERRRRDVLGVGPKASGALESLRTSGSTACARSAGPELTARLLEHHIGPRELVRASQVWPTLCQTGGSGAARHTARNGRLCFQGVVRGRWLWIAYTPSSELATRRTAVCSPTKWATRCRSSPSAPGEAPRLSP